MSLRTSWHGRLAHALHREERRDEAISNSRGFAYFCAFMALAALALPASADAPDPKAILSTFEIHPDFKIELVACEPQVFSPVDVEFDEHGRPFVMEMLGYPFPNDPGRVVMLDDKDGDGFYETRTVFAEGFAMANSLLPYNGGLLVISPPDILFLKDTNGDGVADVREVVLTGLAVENPEDSVNGLTYGLDNWVYCANGGNGGVLRWPDGSGTPLDLRADDFRFNLRTKQMERTGRSAQGFEMSFDPWGRAFTANHTGPLYHRVFPGQFIEGLPQPRGGTLKALPDDTENGLVRIYPIGEQVTRLNHPEQSGYFSGACSPKFYGGGAFGPDFENSIFTCDVVLNLVHRRILVPDGPSFIAKRDNRAKAEFLASTDRAFRPVNLTVAPDGSLWVVDMHRAIIEHPEWIPDEIEKTLDLNAGKNQGRLFRIVPKAGPPRVKSDFRRDKIEDVVAALESKNQWTRTTAQRLLTEWNDPKAVPLIEKLARESKVPVARAHALWTMDGLGELDDETVRKALYDPAPELREQAVRLSEVRVARSRDILNAISQLGNDASPQVRMWSALVLSKAPPMVSSDWTTDLAARGTVDLMLPAAPDQFLRLALTPAFMRAPYGLLAFALPEGKGAEQQNNPWAEMIALFAEAAAPKLAPNEVISLLAKAVDRATGSPVSVRALISGLAAGFEKGGAAAFGADSRQSMAEALSPLLDTKSLSMLRETWRLARALQIEHVPGQEDALMRADAGVRDATLSADMRQQNLRILEFAPFEQRADLLYAMLDTHQPRELQREAIEQLQRVGTPDVARRLIARWLQLGPVTRPLAGDILLYKPGNHALLLTALEKNVISLGEMNFHLERRRVLLRSRDPEIVRRAEALFSDAGVTTRKDAIEKMKPALALTGDPAHGKEIFKNTCAKCHTKGKEGGDIGPNLTEIYRKSRETLMHDILDPNASVDKQFVAYTIERKNGEIVSGLIAEETDAAVTLRDANGVRTAVPRGDIKEMLSNGLSLMPEELESGMDAQTFADLLAFLQQRE